MPHTFAGPDNVPGVAGTLPIIVKVVPCELPQAFTAATVMVPLTNVGAMVTVIWVVPCPVAMVTPAGVLH